jgi:hypothetical protein
MMRLDLEADLAIDPADQWIQGIHREVDHCLAVGALEMCMRSRCCLVGRRWDSKVVDRCGAADVGVRDEPELTECP